MQTKGQLMKSLNTAFSFAPPSILSLTILIIHGDKDNLAPLYMAKEIYNSCKSNKEIYIVHGANHVENYKKDPEGYENVIVQFVGEHSGAF